MEDDDYDDDESYYVEIPAQRFSKLTLLSAGLDFLGHVLEGARCAVGRVEAAVMSHEMRMSHEKAMQDELSWELEALPSTEDPS